MREKHDNKISLKHKSGVYQITIGNDIYIGSSCNLYNRYISHIRYCKTNSHYNKRIQTAYNEMQSFQFDVLEFCENHIEREQYYIDQKKPQLNICMKSDSSLGYKHDASTLERMKEMNKEIANRESVKIKTAKTQFKKGDKPSEKTIQATIERIRKTTIDLETGVIYDSLKEACEATNNNRKREASRIFANRPSRFQYL